MLKMYEGSEKADAAFPQSLDHCSRRFGGYASSLPFECRNPRNVGAQFPRFAFNGGLNETD